MRISDWSSDVCSSDLKHAVGIGKRLAALGLEMQTPPRAEALEDIVRARAGGDEFGFGRAFEIRAAKAQGALKATVLVQHHPRRDQRRPWQMIGEPVGAIAIFAQVQHARSPRWRRWRGSRSE